MTVFEDNSDKNMLSEGCLLIIPNKKEKNRDFNTLWSGSHTEEIYFILFHPSPVKRFYMCYQKEDSHLPL